MKAMLRWAAALVLLFACVPTALGEESGTPEIDWYVENFVLAPEIRSEDEAAAASFRPFVEKNGDELLSLNEALLALAEAAGGDSYICDAHSGGTFTAMKDARPIQALEIPEEMRGVPPSVRGLVFLQGDCMYFLETDSGALRILAFAQEAERSEIETMIGWTHVCDGWYLLSNLYGSAGDVYDAFLEAASGNGPEVEK